MAKLTAELFVTLDGVVSSPDRWHGPFWCEEMGAETEALLAASEVMVLGRNTYDEHVGYWPTADGTMADLMNGIAKRVVTSSDEALGWANSARIAVDDVRRLREKSDVVITGSVALVKTLLADGLVDALHLIVDPITVGEGTRWFDGVQPTEWKAAATTPYPTGAIGVTYVKA
ncbi:dihydrofolate reductase family protein [Kribbella lupini]|uniref:Dihydrofolate reductase family protein n=1 Tax=Kribbella lupini TaxID=291602 RepID=A0ABN2AUI3_9ACTN